LLDIYANDNLDLFCINQQKK